MLSIPSHVITAPGRPRALMRMALEDIVPSRILNRFSKGYVAPLRLRLLNRTLPDLFGDVDQCEVVRRGVVAPDLLRKALHDVRNRSRTSTGNLYMIARLEHWLTLKDSTVRARIPA